MLKRARHRPQKVDGTSEEEDAAMNVTYAGVGVNVALTIVKLVVGIMSCSTALVADAGHSVSDLVSDGVTLWAVRMARLPPDEDHPYGHGRFEAVGALGVSACVFAAGIGIGVEALKLLRQMSCGVCMIDSTCSIPGRAALLACLASILSKEVLFRATDIVGRRLNSPVIRANAKHHRSDVWSSVVALVGVWGARLGFPLLDPVAALGVSLMIMKMGVEVATDALGQLTDTTDEAMVYKIKRAARSVQGAKAVLSAKARSMGSHWLVEVEVSPDEHVRTASAADQLAACVQHAVLEAVADAKECSVRVRSGTPQGSCSRAPAAPTPREIDEKAREVIEATPGIEGVAMTMTKFQRFAPSVDVFIRVAPERTVAECGALAESARRALLAEEPKLTEVNVHLALPGMGSVAGVAMLEIEKLNDEVSLKKKGAAAKAGQAPRPELTEPAAAEVVG